MIGYTCNCHQFSTQPTALSPHGDVTSSYRRKTFCIRWLRENVTPYESFKLERRILPPSIVRRWFQLQYVIATSRRKRKTKLKWERSMTREGLRKEILRFQNTCISWRIFCGMLVWNQDQNMWCNGVVTIKQMIIPNPPTTYPNISLKPAGADSENRVSKNPL